MDDYDIAVLRNALRLIENVRNECCKMGDRRWYRRLDTVCKKIKRILEDCERI